MCSMFIRLSLRKSFPTNPHGSETTNHLVPHMNVVDKSCQFCSRTEDTVTTARKTRL